MPVQTLEHVCISDPTEKYISAPAHREGYKAYLYAVSAVNLTRGCQIDGFFSNQSPIANDNSGTITLIPRVDTSAAEDSGVWSGRIPFETPNALYVTFDGVTAGDRVRINILYDYEKEAR